MAQHCDDGRAAFFVWEKVIHIPARGVPRSESITIIVLDIQLEIDSHFITTTAVFKATAKLLTRCAQAARVS